MNHEKHPKLKKPSHSTYARNAIGLFGAQCSAISALAARMAEQLSDYQILYVDASHKAIDVPNYCNRSSAAFAGELIDEVNQYSISKAIATNAFNDAESRLNQFELINLVEGYDLALVNANHFTPNHTAIIWNSDRLDKIMKREEQLKACRLVFGAERNELPEPLQVALHEGVQCFPDTLLGFDAFIAAVRMLTPPPVIKGLVLAGGRSTRMGRDKTLFNYHGKPQYAYALDLLNHLTEGAWLSVADPDAHPDAKQRITDRFVGMGPFGAILSAFQSDPDAAWLVLASDLPLVDAPFINELLNQRRRSAIATCYLNPETGFPDPLCTLWEPKAYQRMLSFMAMGYSCPRKVLINSDAEVVIPRHPERLQNVNTEEDLKRLNRQRQKH